MATATKLLFMRVVGSTRFVPPLRQPQASQAAQRAFHSLAVGGAEEKRPLPGERRVKKVSMPGPDNDLTSPSFIPPILQESQMDKDALAEQICQLTDQVNQLRLVTTDKSPFDPV